jgi:Transcription factor Tfb2
MRSNQVVQVIQAPKPNKHFLELLGEYRAGVFSYQSIAVGFFKSLSEFHQNLILKLLCGDSTVLNAILVQGPDYQARINEIDDKLYNKVKVVDKSETEDGRVKYKLEKTFADSIKSFLAKGLNGIFQVLTNFEKCVKSSKVMEDKLKVHAFSKWNNMHKYMLKQTSFVHGVEELPVNVVQTLEESGLIMKEGKNNSSCFDFLLDNIKNQVSIFLYGYTKRLIKMRHNYKRKLQGGQEEAIYEGDILNLIFHLTLLYPQVSYSLSKSQESLNELKLTSEVINDILEDLNSVGLVKCRHGNDDKVKNFATTPLIHNIFNPNALLERGFKNDIIVETDFNIYAYSTNLDYIEALLGLFTAIKFKLPTMIICSLEEDKIRRAFDIGITPEQILRYLNSNTHKEVLKSKNHLMNEQEIADAEKHYSYLPTNIVQQVRIWNI